jgi:hypothetical protein
MAYVARVYAFGAKKYSDHNWRKGYAWSLSFDALMRHVTEAQQGEWLDMESGEPHLAHAVFHCLTLITFMLLGLGTDDRPPKCRTDLLSIKIGDDIAFGNRVYSIIDVDARGWIRVPDEPGCSNHWLNPNSGVVRRVVGP